jgi:hypothetical protein
LIPSSTNPRLTLTSKCVAFGGRQHKTWSKNGIYTLSSGLYIYIYIHVYIYTHVYIYICEYVCIYAVWVTGLLLTYRTVYLHVRRRAVWAGTFYKYRVHRYTSC